MSNNSRATSPEWATLQKHRAEHPVDIAQEFETNPARFDEFHLSLDGLLLDYSKQDITAETKTLLLDLARACDIEKQRDAMFSGEPVNITENRPALHTDLRKPENGQSEDIKASLHKMRDFQKKIWDSDITDIVNIGIGGSDIGPYMVCEALRPFSNRAIKTHFVSNMDATHLNETLRELSPETTLFIVCSKSFTTDETLTNAQSAMAWSGKPENFVAVTGKSDAAMDFGIDADNIFPMWDWVGGRFSLWGTIGLSICLSIGFEKFQELLRGAHVMDMHFQTAALDENMPVLMGLLGVWHRNFCDRSALVVLPYDQNLHLLPVYLQQVEMESNGKSTDVNGNRIDYPTAPVVFGQAGTNGQHAFHQLLHQGTDIIPCDFIVPVQTQNPLGAHHEKLQANALGQAQALMQGQKNSNPHQNFEGNRPSTTILIDAVDPYHLGMLLALYEHKVFVEGVIWNINSFDQWGVELGKILARSIFDGTPQNPDPSTTALLRHIQETKKR